MYWTIGKYAGLLIVGSILGWTINGWRLGTTLAQERLVIEQRSIETYKKARETEKELLASVAKLRKDKDAEIKTITSKLNSALAELRSREDRQPSNLSSAPRDCKGANGSELSRQDAEFLTREAARADTIRSALATCYLQYDNVRDSLTN
jgi:hypothetical protein